MSEHLFQRRYDNEPWLDQLASEAHKLPDEKAPAYVAAQGLRFMVPTRPFAVPENPTLMQLIDRMSFLDEVANTREHKKTVNQLGVLIGGLISKTAAETEADVLAVANTMMDFGRLRGVEVDQAAEIILGAPTISGYKPENDAGLTDETVKQFLLDTFGQRLLIETRMLQFKRLPGFLVCFSNYQGQYQKIAESCAIERVGESANFYVFPNRDEYEAGEAILEDVAPSAIEHTYRRRAMSADTHRLEPVVIAEHSIELLEDFDYLQELPYSDSQKRRLYILGSLAHEVGHGMIDSKMINLSGYETAVELDRKTCGRQTSTIYAVEYEEKSLSTPDYNNKAQFLVEDLCEAIRVYVTNPDFLQSVAPFRMEFVQSDVPLITAGSALQAIANDGLQT